MASTVIKYQHSDSVQRINEVSKLIEDGVPFSQTVVNKLMRSLQLPANLKDDFISAAYVGLVEAARRFSPEYGIPFERYAYTRIRGSVIDYIRGNSLVGNSLYKRMKRLQAATELSRLTGATAKDVGLTEEELKTAEEEAENTTLTKNISRTTIEEELDSDRTENSEGPESLLLKKELGVKVLDLVNKLPRVQAAIIHHYYVRDESFTEIAFSVEGCSKSWISRQHKKALQTLKIMLIEAGLIESCRN